MTIHNPTGVKLSKKDIEQGWRFCFEEELKIARPLDAKYKECAEDRMWYDSNAGGKPVMPGYSNWSNTYITQAPRPKDCGPIVVPVISDDPLAVLAKMLGTS